MPSEALARFLDGSPAKSEERVVSAVDPFEPGSGRLLRAAGVLATFDLFAVAATVRWRRLTGDGSSCGPGGDGNRGRAS